MNSSHILRYMNTTIMIHSPTYFSLNSIFQEKLMKYCSNVIRIYVQETCFSTCPSIKFSTLEHAQMLHIPWILGIRWNMYSFLGKKLYCINTDNKWKRWSQRRIQKDYHIFFETIVPTIIIKRSLFSRVLNATLLLVLLKVSGLFLIY